MGCGFSGELLVMQGGGLADKDGLEEHALVPQ